MSKKYYALILIWCALILLTGAYNHSQNQEKQKQEKPIKWNIVSVYPHDNPIHQKGMEKFARDVNIISKGELEIKYHAKGEYENINSDDVFDAVSKGTVEMGFGASIYWKKEKKQIPGNEFWYAVPFGLSANGMYAWLYRGGGLKLWRKIYEPYNVIPFPVGNIGGAMGGWFKNEIKSIDDFRGMKIRMTDLHSKVMQKLGAEGVWMSVRDAIKDYEDGKIDAIVCLGPYADERYKLHKLNKLNKRPIYYYYPGWQEPGGILSLIINKKKFDDLPEHLKKTIEIVCGNTYNFIYNQFEKMNSEYFKIFQESKEVTVLEFPPEVMIEFTKRTKEVLEEEAENKKFNEIYQAFKRFKEENIESGWGKVNDDEVYSTKK